MAGVDLDGLGEEKRGKKAERRWGSGEAVENKVLNIRSHKYVRCVRAANQHKLWR